MLALGHVYEFSEPAYRCAEVKATWPRLFTHFDVLAYSQDVISEHGKIVSPHLVNITSQPLSWLVHWLTIAENFAVRVDVKFILITVLGPLHERFGRGSVRGLRNEE